MCLPISVADSFLADISPSVLGSGIARVVSYVQAVSITNEERAAFFKDTSCKYESRVKSLPVIFSSS